MSEASRTEVLLPFRHLWGQMAASESRITTSRQNCREVRRMSKRPYSSEGDTNVSDFLHAKVSSLIPASPAPNASQCIRYLAKMLSSPTPWSL
jgi:hypothetical protein